MAKQKINPSQNTSELGYAEATSAQGSITTITDLTGLSVTVTVPSGATIEIEGWVSQIYSSVAGDRADLSIREGSTTLSSAYNRVDGSSTGWGGAYVKKRTQPSAGSHTYKISLARGVGTGSLSTYAAADAAAFISVKVV